MSRKCTWTESSAFSDLFRHDVALKTRRQHNTNLGATSLLLGSIDFENGAEPSNRASRALFAGTGLEHLEEGGRGDDRDPLKRLECQ
jgi:hypothetical protein